MAKVDALSVLGSLYGGAVGRFVEMTEDRPRPRQRPKYTPEVLSGQARALRDELVPTFQDVESRYGLPEGLLERVAFQESSFRPRRNDASGATGLMQIMPGVHREELSQLGLDPNNPGQAIEFAGRYLQRLHKRFGRWDHALAAYNAGQGNVVRHGGIPPFAETQKYVSNIWGDYQEESPTMGPSTAITEQRERMTPVQADATRVTQPEQPQAQEPNSGGQLGWLLRGSNLYPRF